MFSNARLLCPAEGEHPLTVYLISASLLRQVWLRLSPRHGQGKTWPSPPGTLEKGRSAEADLRGRAAEASCRKRPCLVGPTFVRSVARPVPRAEAAAARRLQRMSAGQRSANCNRRDAVALAIGQAARLPDRSRAAATAAKS